MDGKAVFDDFACLHEPATALLAAPMGKGGAAGGFLTVVVDAAGRRLFPGGQDRRNAPAKAGYSLQRR